MTTQLKALFEKPINRHIEGVIKADDDAGLRGEIEEYVITNEIEKRLEGLLDAYNNYEGANGVWISGFFGSGKSHLLKMLSLTLENKGVDGINAADAFMAKCDKNEILRGDLKRSTGIQSKSILFNIDQKADVISKDQIDALLGVFQKVFDEMCGYYGKQGHIAKFERDLDSRGQLAAFKDAYARIAGKPWERGREQALLEGPSIASAYSEVSGTDVAAAQGLLSGYRNDYKVSIEDFAQQVKDYIDRQGQNFRLNFFVDEVGQYIADNVKLMTNLQTIAESLNTKCRGRSWIFVTAQEDMNAVIGVMSSRQAHDFSKIQARFANRMPLTSADVAEVIQKRLLMKTDEAVAELSDLYHAHTNNLKTLFDFSDGSVRLQNFKDREHFIQSYPFIPYQYTLFQMAIQGLSQHGAFEGQHSSVGERSMLGVFQDVAIHIADMPVGRLATFDLMFEGIRSALKSTVQQSVQIAERNLNNEFAVRVLKALFLLKYVRPFKATVRNISVLMLDDFDEDVGKLQKRIEESLAMLEQQTYIQRNGDLYEFLTDEEKDIEEEIKAIDVDSADIDRELEQLIFDSVIKSRKIRHDSLAHDYAYSRKLDDRLVGREYELTVNIITPFHEHAGKPDNIRMQSMSRDELAVVLPADARFVADLLTYKRTDKFVKQSRSTTQLPAIERIVSEKGSQNAMRQRELAARAASLIAQSQLFVRGDELDIRSEDAQERLARGFQTLIDKTYVNLGMLKGVTYAETDVGRFLKQAEDGLFGNHAAPLTEAEQELLNFAQSNNRTGIRTTVKAMIEKFERKPYGWPYAAIICNVASLCGRAKLEARADGSVLSNSDLDKALRNTHAQSNIVLEPQVEYSAAQIRQLKEFFSELFDAQPANSDGRLLAKETAERIGQLAAELKSMVGQSARYPFLSQLRPILDKCQEIAGKPHAWYFSDLPKMTDELLEAKEKDFDPIRKFMNGPQKGIYDRALSVLEQQAQNLAYIGREEGDRLRDLLRDPSCIRGQAIQKIKSEADALEGAINTYIDGEVARLEAEVGDARAKIENLHDFSKLSEADQATILAAIVEAAATAKTGRSIAFIREREQAFKTALYPQLLSKVAELAQPKTSAAASDDYIEPPSSSMGGLSEGTQIKPKPKAAAQPTYVSSATVKVPFAKPYLATETDVTEYLDAMRDALIAEIRIGKRITV